MAEGIPVPTRPRTGREKVLPTLVAMAVELAAMRQLLEEALAHPRIEVREWRPDHRRIKDGGTHVNDQRRAVRKIVADGDLD